MSAAADHHHAPRESAPRRPPLVFAHRGASAVRAENTIEAFEVARAMGAGGVELDVHLLADGLLAVHHDPELADGRPLASLTWRELPARVPLLDPVVDACGDMVLNIEIKPPPEELRDRTVDAVVGLVARRGIRARTIVSSFSMGTIDLVHARDPELPTAVLTERGAELLGPTAERGHVAIHPWRDIPDEAYMDAARAVGLAVNVWTVDDHDAIRRLASLGVDGIVTNVPDEALRVLGGHDE